MAKARPGEFRLAISADPFSNPRGLDRHLGRTIKAVYFVSDRRYYGYGRFGIPLSYAS